VRERPLARLFRVGHETWPQCHHEWVLRREQPLPISGAWVFRTASGCVSANSLGTTPRHRSAQRPRLARCCLRFSLAWPSRSSAGSSISEPTYVFRHIMRNAPTRSPFSHQGRGDSSHGAPPADQAGSALTLHRQRHGRGVRSSARCRPSRRSSAATCYLARVPGGTILLSELASFPHGANDDQVDALAYAVRELERSAKVTSW
jgi:hypothetical protein